MISLIFKKLFFLTTWAFRPFFRFFQKKYAAFFETIAREFTDPYWSGMISRFNLCHEWIFKPNFEKVRLDAEALALLKDLSQKGTLVYVMKQRGQLEYSFFNHRFLKEGIPLARFANGSRTLFWRPVGEIFKAVLGRIQRFYDKGLLEDPIESGYLEKLVADGESVLLNLKVSRELIFGVDESPLQFIPPLLSAARKSARPVYLITQQYLYDRHPEKETKSWMDFLFGEKSNPGMFRKLILFMMNYGKSATVKIGQPLDLKIFLAENGGLSASDLSIRLNQTLLSRLMIERRSITGPALKPREEFLEKLLRDRHFKEALSELASSTGKKREDLERTATRHFMEIAANVNYTYVDLYSRLIDWMSKNIYEGLDIDMQGLARIKAVAGKHPLVFVPSHKSHIDYLLLSYISYEYDLTLPHICAGINLNFWPASHFLRRGGGFFIRRSFSGDKLYKLVLEHYLKILVRGGYTVEFFIEGTRSRTGKLLKPRMGILSMLVQSFLDGDVEDLSFVPVSINYERILEGKSYVEEIHGASKQNENVGDIIKARKFFSKKYGKVFVRFAEPLSLKQFLAEKNLTPPLIRPAGTFSPRGEEDHLRKTISDFAYELTYHINRITVVTPTALVATSLLADSRKGICQDSILKRVKVLQHYLEYKKVDFSDLIRQRSDWAYAEALEKLVSEKTIGAHRDFHEKFYTIDEPGRVTLDYQKNNALHFFVSLSAVSKILSQTKSPTSLDEICKRYETLKILLSEDFTFSTRQELADHIVRVLDFYVQEGLVDFDRASGRVNFDQIHNDERFVLFTGLLDNFYESLYFTLLYLKHVDFQAADSKKLVAAVYEAGRVLFLKGEIRHRESLSQFNIRNCLGVFEKLGLVRRDDKGLFSRAFDAESIKQWEGILLQLLGKSYGGIQNLNLTTASLASRPEIVSEKNVH